MKAITLTILIGLMVICGITYPPKTSDAEVVKKESPIQVLQHNEAVIQEYKELNDWKTEAVLANIKVIDSLNKR